MKKSKLEPPHIKNEVTKRIAAGESRSSIARSMGISHTTVGRFVRRDEVQRLIEEETLKLLEVLPDAVENVKTLVREMKRLSSKVHKGRELSFKASQKVLESAGIMNAPTPSQVVVNIVKKEGPMIPPFIRELIKKHFADGYDFPGEEKKGEIKD